MAEETPETSWTPAGQARGVWGGSAVKWLLLACYVRPCGPVMAYVDSVWRHGACHVWEFCCDYPSISDYLMPTLVQPC